MKNGDEILGATGWCDLCDYSFGGSATLRRVKYLNGKLYHPKCYPLAVKIYLADLKLKENQK